MGNYIFKALLNEKIEHFKNSFSNVSKEIFFDEKTQKLIHPGEYGMYREVICKEFIRFVIPTRLDIEQGFLITPEDKISHQCDIVVFDKNITPLFENGERQRFFPIETICAIGEVKSTLTREDFINALNKLSKVKPLRSELNEPTLFGINHDKKFKPFENNEDQIITFLICQSFNFNFNNIESEINSLYDSENQKYKHNFVLSLQDGLLLYKKNNIVLPYEGNDQMVLPCFIKADKENSHIKVFVSNLFLTTSSTTILFPHIANYLK